MESESDGELLAAAAARIQIKAAAAATRAPSSSQAPAQSQQAAQSSAIPIRARERKFAREAAANKLAPAKLDSEKKSESKRESH